MKVNLDKDEALVWILENQGYPVDIPEKEWREFKKAEKAYWKAQDKLERFWDKYREWAIREIKES